MSSRDEASEKRESTSLFSTDHCGLIRQVHRLQCPTELYDTGKLPGVSKSLIDAFRDRRKYRLLVNGVGRGDIPSLVAAETLVEPTASPAMAPITRESLAAASAR